MAVDPTKEDCANTAVISFVANNRVLNKINIIIMAYYFSNLCLVAQIPSSSFEKQALDAESARIFTTYPGHAVNIILFIGDGMGVTTVTAARILDGQLKGNSGEENVLFMETFDHMSMSKTYNVDAQCPDSAATMHAIMTGHKTKMGTLGYSKEVIRGDITSTKEAGGDAVKHTTMLEIFEKMGRSTGVISTAEITHATPAACYAKSIDRGYKSDIYLAYNTAAINAGAKDIARQLIEFPYGDGIDVAMGGGRYSFKPIGRMDREDLTKDWLNQPNSIYIQSLEELGGIDYKATDKVLGLFGNGHMSYEYDRATVGENQEPSLSEMTVSAIRILRKNPKGFFLMVEGGRIDHAHHASNAYRALTDTIEFDNAIESAFEELTTEEKSKTLIVVTADHGHVFTLGGHANRGNPILGIASGYDFFGQPYTIANYANGGGYTGPMINIRTSEISNGGQNWLHSLQGPKAYSGEWEYLNFGLERPSLTSSGVQSPNYIQESLIPLRSETHSIEDVPVYAIGPGAHMFRGTREQNYIFHVMNEAIKPVLTIEKNKVDNNESLTINVNGFGSLLYNVEESKNLKNWSTIEKTRGSSRIKEDKNKSQNFYRVNAESN